MLLKTSQSFPWTLVTVLTLPSPVLYRRFYQVQAVRLKRIRLSLSTDSCYALNIFMCQLIVVYCAQIHVLVFK